MIDTFNTDLAVEVLANIEATKQYEDVCPIGHNQSQWGLIPRNSTYEGHVDVPDLDVLYDQESGLPIGLGTCGTAMCFAGWALSVSGVRMKWTYDPDNDAYVANLAATGETVEATGADLLGLYCTCDDRSGDCVWSHNYADMPRLFMPGLSLDAIYRLVADYSDIDEPVLRVMVKERIDASVIARLAETHSLS